MLTKLTDHISILDTLALGRPNVVAAYLVTGKQSALVDMGYRSSTKTVLRDLEGRTIDYLLPTHVHLDHSGACGTLAKKFPNAAIRSTPNRSEAPDRSVALDPRSHRTIWDRLDETIRITRTN